MISMLESPGLRTVLMLVVLAGLSGCQQPGVDHSRIDHRLIGEVMMHSEFSANLRARCMSGGRLSGSPNGHEAEQYVAGKLREYGLSNVHFEPFEMTTWRNRTTVVTALGDPSSAATTAPHVLEGALSLGNCLSTPPEGITAELVAVGQGSEAEFEGAGERLQGKFAFIREGGLHRSEKMTLALAHGVAGMVQVSKLEDRGRVGQCHAEPRPEPGITITGADGAALAERMKAGERVRLNVKIDADAWQAQPNNVVAEIPGTGSLAHETVILCGHLDSWHLAEGAIDNGTGAAAILEAARALRALDWNPKRTVRIVWFMGEEHGLYGSCAYVQAHLDELDDVIAVINVDMPGSPRKFATFGHPEVVDFLQSVRADLTGFEISEETANATWTASDHAPFMKQGVCAVALFGDCGPGVKYYHSTGDKFEEVDRRGTIQSAAALAVLVRRLADYPERPTKRLDPIKLAKEMGWDEL